MRIGKKYGYSMMLAFVLLAATALLTLSGGRYSVQNVQNVQIEDSVLKSSAFGLAKLAENMNINVKALEAEALQMQMVYQLARRSIVKVAAANAAGSGVIWTIDNDRIVIAASRHLLMKDVKAAVTFCNNEVMGAKIMGYSQQYDVGYLYIDLAEASDKLLRDIYEVVPSLYDADTDEGRTLFLQEYAQKDILQIGAGLEGGIRNFYKGKVAGLRYMPLFNTYMLETDCYSKAGMSGGGVFEENGRFLGMVSGGDVAEDGQSREAETTFSIPARLIENEYHEVLSAHADTGKQDVSLLD